VRRPVDLRVTVPVAALLLAVSGHAGPTTGEVPIWVETTPTTRPPVSGFTFPLVYDAVAERVVFPINADMWAYDGVAWTLVPGGGTSVPTGFLSLAAFDGARGAFVGYGGPDAVWEWRSGTWTHAATGAPDLAELVYDDRLGKVVGISSPATTGPLALYTYDGAIWSPLPASDAPIFYGFAATYDVARARIVIFGGAPAPDMTVAYPSDETFEFDGTTWIHPQPVVRPTARTARLTYDAARARTVLFGGTGPSPAQQPLGDTWEWDGTAWEPRFPASAPEPRRSAPIAYDARRRRVVLFGHGISLGTANDTWEYSTYAGACASDAQCDTAICDRGICCHEACGPCQTCDASGAGCLAIQGADDPDSCTGTNTCDAAGRCKEKGGQACLHASDCASGECSLGACCTARCAPFGCDAAGACKSKCAADADCATSAFCRDGACLTAPATCAAPARSRSSQGTEQDCTPFACEPVGGSCRTACASSDDCADGFLCSSGQTCRSAPPATAAGCSVGAGRRADVGAIGGFGALALGLAALLARTARRRKIR